MRGYVNVKPTLLMDGESVGLDKVRQGTAVKPAIGYTIWRRDVGAWMFHRLVEKAPQQEWINGAVNLSY